tara:strand:- start:1167 stop:1790 length:624 start_codon:yes stop_codon:yes gene_type:complete
MIKKDSFIVYRSFFEASILLTDKDRLALYDAIFEFGLNHNEIELEGYPKGMFSLIKPQLEANYRKWKNGLKGGKATQDKWAKQGQDKGKAIAKEGQSNSKSIANVNDNVNVNDNDKERIGLPLKSGDDYFLTPKLYLEIQSAYPNINFREELLKMRAWLISNPSKQKTHVGTPRFVTNWLSKSKPKESVTDSYASIHQAVLEKKNVQ